MFTKVEEDDEEWKIENVWRQCCGSY